MDQTRIDFLIQPIDNYKMEFSCDDKKEKPLSGRNNSRYPMIEVYDPNRCRSGRLKIVCADADQLFLILNQPLYRLHRHRLVDYMSKTTNCDNFGVATFNFNTEDYQNDRVQVELQSLSIRRSRERLKDVETNWKQNQNDKFDPFGVGFGDLSKNVDLNRVRLCCQAIFNDNERSNILVSDEIQNCKPEIIVHKWKNVSVKVTGGDSLYVFVSELKRMQRKVYAIFYDDETNTEYAQVEIEYVHCNRALCIIAPPYTRTDITAPVRCKFNIAVRNKSYKSDLLYFHYIPLCKCENPSPMQVADGIVASNYSAFDFIDINFGYMDDYPEHQFMQKDVSMNQTVDLFTEMKELNDFI